MTTGLDEAIESLAKEIKEIASVVKFDSLILLMYAGDVVGRYLDIEMSKYGQDQTRFNILYLLVGYGGSMTPTNISKRVYRSKHAITRAIDVLEKDSLVKRQRTSDDRRSINITITRKGVQLVKRSLPDLQRVSSKATSCLNNKQVEQLRTIARELRNHLLTLIGNSAY